MFSSIRYLVFAFVFLCSSNSDAQNSEESKSASCRYRNHTLLYPFEIWHYVVAGYCYNYTIPSRRAFTHNMTLLPGSWNGVIYKIPAVKFKDNSTALFDYANETFVNEVIAPSFKIHLYVEQWIECVENGISCCRDYEHNQIDNEDSCPIVWDGWQCWQETKPDTVVFQECAIYSFTSGERICALESFKECFPNGTWNVMTNNIPCAVAPIYRRRHNFHIMALSVSIALTLPAVIIYFSFSKLREPKDWETFNLPLYRNLLLCILVKNALTITSKRVVILSSLDINETETDYTVLETNGVSCRVLAFFENWWKNTIFTCMLVIGFFLHKSIARFFAGGNTYKMYWIYLGVLTVSFIPSLAWAIVKALIDNEYCWVVDILGHQWITDGFKFLILGINLLFLLDIVRVLMTGRIKSDSKVTKTAVKATLFLIPLFGVPLLLTGQRSLFISSDSCSDVYFYVTYIIEASQSVIVAVLFCYMNKRVHTEMKKSYKQFAINMEQRYNVKLWKPGNEPRRTATTNVMSKSKHTALIPLKQSPI